jgi:predicted kinase
MRYQQIRLSRFFVILKYPNMPKLIIVCGLPGSGKTTLAAALASKLNIVCLHKDSIKENLYDILGLSTLEDSKRIGIQSIRLLLALAEEQIANKTDVIIEAPFNYAADYPLFVEWVEKYHVSLYVVICRISAEERKTRSVNRPRHASHHATERYANENFDADNSVYDTMPGTHIKLVCDQPIEQLVEQALKHIS